MLGALKIDNKAKSRFIWIFALTLILLAIAANSLFLNPGFEEDFNNWTNMGWYITNTSCFEGLKCAYTDMNSSVLEIYVSGTPYVNFTAGNNWTYETVNLSAYAGTLSSIQFHVASGYIQQMLNLTSANPPIEMGFQMRYSSPDLYIDDIQLSTSLPDANIAIWTGGETYTTGDTARFFAEYTDDSFTYIYSANTSCIITFIREDHGLILGPYNMTFNTSSEYHEYSALLDTGGIDFGAGYHEWNVTCSDPGFTTEYSMDYLDIMGSGDYCSAYNLNVSRCNLDHDCYYINSSCEYDPLTYCAQFTSDNDCDTKPGCGWDYNDNWCRSWGDFCSQWHYNQTSCEEEPECMYLISDEFCAFDNTTYCSQFLDYETCDPETDCHWDEYDRHCKTNAFWGYCRQYDWNSTMCSEEPSCFFNTSKSKCYYNDSSYCAQFSMESNCEIDEECHWDFFDNRCYHNTWEGDFGDCKNYDNNETGCISEENCEYDSENDKCFFAPKCYLHDDNETKCWDIGCDYDFEKSKCFMEFGDSDCYSYTNTTSCLDTGYCEWDFYTGECYQDFEDECPFYDGQKALCEQQPACMWFEDEQICDPAYDGGFGSYCWDYDGNETGCTEVGGCMWFPDPFMPGEGWCDPKGSHEDCFNGMDDTGNGKCDKDGCTINGTFLPPDPDCSFDAVFENIGYTVNYPNFGPNLEVNKINITFHNISKVGSAWYVLNYPGKEYCDWWFNNSCKDGNITLAENSITDIPLLEGEYDLSIFVKDKKGMIHPFDVFFFSGSTEEVKPRITLLHPRNNTKIPYNSTIEFEIDPRGPFSEVKFSIDGIDKGKLPGKFFHVLPANESYFPAEGSYEIEIRAENTLLQTVKTYKFLLNDSDEVFHEEALDFAQTFDNFVDNRSDKFKNSSFFKEDEFEVIEIMGLADIIDDMKLQIRSLKQELENETNSTRIKEIKEQISGLKSQVPGEVEILEKLNDTLQNTQGSYIDSVIRNLKNQTGLDIDLAQTQNTMKNLTEIRKEPKKVQLKYLDGTIKNVTKVTEKFVSNSTGTRSLSYVLHDELVSRDSISTATKTILLPDGTALLEINKNITGQNNLDICLFGLSSCSSSNLSQINTSVIDITGDLEFTILKSDPIVKWTFTSSENNNDDDSDDNQNNNDRGGGGGSSNSDSDDQQDQQNIIIQNSQEDTETTEINPENQQDQSDDNKKDVESSEKSDTDTKEQKNINGFAKLFMKKKSKILGKDEQLSLEVNSQQHTLTVAEIAGDKAKIIIKSDPIELWLDINQKKKVDLDKDNFYDLEVYLRDIRDGKADIEVTFLEETRLSRIVGHSILSVKENPTGIAITFLVLVVGLLGYYTVSKVRR